MDAIVHWLTPTGHRFTNASDSLSVDVSAWTDIANEGGIASVTFTINGVDTVVNTRTMRTPNYNEQRSPITGTTTMSKVAAYGVDVDASAYAAGTITITAKATSVLGTETPLPGSIVIYNDKTGDQRPSTKTIYVNADSGNDSNPGTIGSPVLSIQQACVLVAESGDMGGGTVILQPSTAEHEWARGGNYFSTPPLFTGGDWWVTIRAQVGARITRPGAYDPGGNGPFWTTGLNELVLHGNYNGSTYDGAVRVKLILEDPDSKQVSRGDLKIATRAGVTTELYVEGGRFGDPNHDPVDNRWSVLFAENGTALFDNVADASSERTTYWAACVRGEGLINGFFGYQMVHDCHVADWTGIALQTTDRNPSSAVVNTHTPGQRYNQEVAGYIDCAIGGGKVEIIKLDASTMRIRRRPGQTLNFWPWTSPSNPSPPSVQSGVQDLEAQGAVLAQSNRWGVRLKNCANAGNNTPEGTTAWPVVGFGNDGQPYIDVTNPNAVNEIVSTPVGGTTGAGLHTARKDTASGLAYTDSVHTDVWQFLAECDNTLIYGVSARDCTGTRVWATSSSTYDRMAFVNCGDNFFAQATHLGGTAMTNVLFFHCTFNAAFILTGSSYSNVEVRNCVFDQMSTPPSGVLVDGCHFRDGNAHGTNTSTGVWFAGDPESAPFFLTPTIANQGTAPAGLWHPAEFAWPNAGGNPTKGVWRDLGELTQGASPSSVTGTIAASLGPGTASFTGGPGSVVTGSFAASMSPGTASFVASQGFGVNGTFAAGLGPGSGSFTGSLTEVAERTHYYHLIGDAHLRGHDSGPEIMNPLGEQRVEVVTPPSPPAEIGDVVRGQTSKAVMMITRIVSPTKWIGESLAADPPLPPLPSGAFAQAINPGALPFSGETVNLSSGGTATVHFSANAQSLPGFLQFLGEANDVELGAVIPGGADDGVFWYPSVRRARNASLSGFTGISPYFRKGDRVSSTSGGTAIVKLVSGPEVKLVQVTGLIKAGDTLTNETLGPDPGPPSAPTAAYVDAIESEWPLGEWAPFSIFPNVRGLGTFYERQPQGNDASGRKPRIGIEARLLSRIHAHHLKSPIPADRGFRAVQYSTLDGFVDGSGNGLEGGVIVQIVHCTGTFPATWTPGELVTSSSGAWQATVLGYNATQKKLFVIDTNGVVLTSGTLTGASSGTQATNDGAAYGWQKGSRHWELWRANLQAAIAAPNSRFLGAPIKHEHIVAMVWETELRPFAPSYGCPIPSQTQVVEQFAQWIADMREEVGDNTESVGVTLWQHRVESQQHAVFIPTPSGNLPFSYILRGWIGAVRGKVRNVTVVDSHTVGAKMGPNNLYLRTMDYPDALGEAFWRHMRFGQVSTPQGSGRELLPVGIHVGQSQMTGFTNAGLAMFGDPELFPHSNYEPGVTSVDSRRLVWNPLTKQIEPAAMDINLNGWWGTRPGTSGPEVPLLARMPVRFSESVLGGAKFCLFKATIPGSCKNRNVIGASACWDPELASRPSIGPTCTVTVIPAAGGFPARGRFTSTPGTFTQPFWQPNMAATITGSGQGLAQAVGGNNTPPWTVNHVSAIANDGSWIEFDGVFVDEGPRTFTMHAGPPPAWGLFTKEWDEFVAAAVEAGYMPIPVYIWDDQAEADLELPDEYAPALDRFWEAMESHCGQKLKGAEPIAKLISLLHTQTPVDVADSAIETVRQAQIAKAAALTNCEVLDPSDLALEMSAQNEVVRLERRDHGIHLTPLSQLTKGFRADRILGGFGPSKGIPAHPAGELEGDGFGDVNGGTAAIAESPPQLLSAPQTLEKAGEASTSPEKAASLISLTAVETDGLLQAIEDAWGRNSDIVEYSINGQTVKRRGMAEMIELHKYLTAIQTRRAGVRRTRVRFS